jgi:hypothetical protein
MPMMVVVVVIPMAGRIGRDRIRRRFNHPVLILAPLLSNRRRALLLHSGRDPGRQRRGAVGGKLPRRRTGERHGADRDGREHGPNDAVLLLGVLAVALVVVGVFREAAVGGAGREGEAGDFLGDDFRLCWWFGVWSGGWWG